MSAAIAVPLLLVEDSEDDLFFFRRLSKKAGVPDPIAIATDGQRAIDLLQAACAPGGTIPRLVFLDLKLPLRSGFEVLQWLRAQPYLSRTVVIVLSSSAEARDVQRAFELGAQGYLVKYPEPPVLAHLVQSVAALPAETDLKSVTLPGLPRPS